ncbi:MAG: hypothetical protein ACPLXC_00730 [Candidatus Pacearchaeota archaeon]
MNIIKNKKGQAGESMADLSAAVILVLLLIVFFILSNTLWARSSVDIKKFSSTYSKIDQEHFSLYSWLQKSVLITYENQKQNITIAELIILTDFDRSYNSLLNIEAKKAFGEDFEFQIISEEEITRIGWQPAFIAGQFMLIPSPTMKGILFYIPSPTKNKPIFVNIAKKEVK